MRSIATWGLLIGGAGLFAFGWLEVVSSTALGILVGLLLVGLAWVSRRSVEPLALLAAAYAAGQAIEVVIEFTTIASSGGQVVGAYFAVVGGQFGRGAILAAAALLRLHLHAPRLRGAPLAWFVLVHAAWWGWQMQSLSVSSTSNHYQHLGHVPLFFSVASATLIAVLIVLALRRRGYSGCSRWATSASVAVILGLVVPGIAALEAPSFDVPITTTGEPVDRATDIYRPILEVRRDGTLVAHHVFLDPATLGRLLLVIEAKLGRGDHLALQVEGATSLRVLHPTLHALVECNGRLETVHLVGKGPVPERTWREAFADVVHGRAGERVLPVSLRPASSVPARWSVRVAADGWTLVGPDPHSRVVALEVAPDLTVGDLVEVLDEVRGAGASSVTLLVPRREER